jgi:hypothetical protein
LHIDTAVALESTVVAGYVQMVRHVKTLLCLFLLLPATALAVEIRETVWGFDGKVVPGRFNLLSVLVFNPAGSAFEGELHLYRSDRLGGRYGAEQVAPCYLSPGSSRWLQLYPYVAEENEEWVLVWGRGSQERMLLSSPRLGPPALVTLDAPDDPFTGHAGIRTFREDLFPPTVAATDGLYGVVIDHPPRWQEPQRQAFLDWLRAGGTVHLIHSSSQEFPVFTGELAVLNRRDDRFNVGSGVVARHPFVRSQVSTRLLTDSGYPPLQLQTNDQASIDNLESDLLWILRRMTTVKHSWWLIYSLLLLYMVLIGPLSYLLVRRNPKASGVGHALLFFLALVVVFSFLISRAGRRGYGEAAMVKSIAYARPIGPDSYDLTQWVDVFVTRGDLYTMSYPADSSLFSTCQRFEPVPGRIVNGSQGHFTVDMPVYSSRSFLARTVVKGEPLAIEVKRWVGSNTIESLQLGISFGETPIIQGWAGHRGRYYPLTAKDGELRTGASSVSIEHMLSQIGVRTESRGVLKIAGQWQDDSPQEAMRKLAPVLIDWSRSGAVSFRHSVQMQLPPQQPDRIELFILTDYPSRFGLTAQGLDRQVGCLLLHTQVERPEMIDE